MNPPREPLGVSPLRRAAAPAGGECPLSGGYAP